MNEQKNEATVPITEVLEAISDTLGIPISVISVQYYSGRYQGLSVRKCITKILDTFL